MRLLGPPDRGNVIPLERHRQLVLVIGDEAGQRHCKVIAQTDGTIAMIEKVIHQLLVLAGLASQDLQVLEGWRVDRLETMRLEDLASALDQCAPEQHLRRKLIAKA